MQIGEDCAMMPGARGAIRLGRVAGIKLFLHWSWFVVAAYEISDRAHSYSSLLRNGLEYLALFAIVLLHELGHSLACRQVGGIAEQIVLWPLGGVAYVNPPQRPGAMLWSIAAGPLVNLGLLPVLTVVMLGCRAAGWPADLPNAYALLRSIWIINLVLLIFNLLPIYPLDGGQILRSLLWFWLGRAKSLMAASAIGFVGVAAMFGLALWARSMWNFVLAVFILLNCWSGLRQARALAALAKAPRRDGFACPSCHALPILGPLWMCNQCRNPFDTFETNAVCPHCGAQFLQTRCVECGRLHPIGDWARTAGVPPPR